MPVIPRHFWKVHAYTVRIGQAGAGDDNALRILTVTNRSGLVRASLSFRTGPNLGSISLLGPPSPVREQVHAWFPVSQFAEAYEALRSEEPVFIGYTWAPDPSDPDRYGELLQVSITSEDQPWWD